MLFGHPRIGVPELRRNDTHRHTAHGKMAAVRVP